MCKLRLAAVAALIPIATFAKASPLYEEMVQQTDRLIASPKLVPSQQLWQKRNHEKLMSMIEGVWIQASEKKMDSEKSYLELCNDLGFSFKRLTDYSFDIFLVKKDPAHEIHIEYIFKSGIVYNTRSNIEQQFAEFGRDQPNGPTVLRDANTSSVLIALSPNTILEADTEGEKPILWSRCPAS